MLELLFQNPSEFILILGGIAIAIGIHEYAHCLAADKLGDPTPRSQGRLSINPLNHLDPIGTLMIILTGTFGWGKPAPFDPYNLQNPNRDTKIIALAGPVSNIILAFILSIIFRLFSLPDAVSDLVIRLFYLNIGLAVFNMLPIPPLDGSKIFFPYSYWSKRGNDFILLLVFVLPIFGGQSLAGIIMTPVVRFVASILL